MEILLITFTVLLIVTSVVLVGTRGNPVNLIRGFRDTLFGVWDNLGALAIISAIVVLTAALIYFFFLAGDMRAGPLQPISFSHRVHAGHKAIDCKFCHPYVDKSIHPGLPPVEKCLYCHNHIITQHPEIRKEHDYFNTNTPTPWKKVFYLPEHVLFNHERHIKKEVACESCHGEVKSMDRLKGTRFKMGFCLDCHREKKAPVGCWLTCHN